MFVINCRGFDWGGDDVCGVPADVSDDVFLDGGSGLRPPLRLQLGQCGLGNDGAILLREIFFLVRRIGVAFEESHKFRGGGTSRAS